MIWRRRALHVTCAAIALAIAACTRPSGGPGEPGESAPPGAVVSSLDGVVLTVVVEPNPVARGARPSIIATLRNDRDTAVDWSGGGGCGFANLEVTVPVPWEPTGRTWSGVEGWFKSYLLEHAYGPGGVAAFSPVTATLLSTPCEDGLGESLLRPGDSLRADFTRAIGNFLTTYPYTSSVPFSINVDIDRQNTPPPVEPGEIPQHFFPEYRHVTANGELSIAGPTETVLTAGQAIDALLGNDRFTAWLAAQPSGTCETANLSLDAGQPVDAGPVWYIGMYCETNVPRHYFGAQVDAATGEVRQLRFCDDACE